MRMVHAVDSDKLACMFHAVDSDQLACMVCWTHSAIPVHCCDLSAGKVSQEDAKISGGTDSMFALVCNRLHRAGEG